MFNSGKTGICAELASNANDLLSLCLFVFDQINESSRKVWVDSSILELYKMNFGKDLTLFSISNHDETKVLLNPTKQELMLIAEILAFAQQRYEMVAEKESFTLSITTIQNFQMQMGNFLNAIIIAAVDLSYVRQFVEQAILLLKKYSGNAKNSDLLAGKRSDKLAVKRMNNLLIALEEMSTGTDQTSKHCQVEFLVSFFRTNSQSDNFRLCLKFDSREMSMLYTDRLKAVMKNLAKAQTWRVLELLCATNRIDSVSDPVFFEKPEKLNDILLAEAEQNMFLDPKKVGLLFSYYHREKLPELKKVLKSRLESMTRL